MKPDPIRIRTHNPGFKTSREYIYERHLKVMSWKEYKPVYAFNGKNYKVTAFQKIISLSLNIIRRVFQPQKNSFKPVFLQNHKAQHLHNFDC
jgi:hypothetical protein